MENILRYISSHGTALQNAGFAPRTADFDPVLFPIRFAVEAARESYYGIAGA